MQIRFFGFATAAAASAFFLAASPAAHAQQTAYAIANGGSTLISFSTANPLGAVAVGNFSIGGTATFLDAIDFRPLNGQLYGYLDSTDTLYTVNLSDASLTAVASGSGASATNTNLLGIDFNPSIDRVRVVTDSTQNLVYNPNSNAAPTVTTPLFYPAGDPGASSARGPLVIENAYDNNVAGATFSTAGFQYGIDYGTDTLVRIANNAGTLTTVGSLGVNINDSAPFVGFDIFTALGGSSPFTANNLGYAILDTTAGTTPTFYNINLGNGQATAIGGFGNFQQVYSLAVTPTAAITAAPEPGTLALLALGSSLLGGVALRRKRRA